MENESNLTTLNGTFKVRGDKALTLPQNVRLLLKWEIGDECLYTIDTKNHRLIISRPEKEEQ